MTRRLSILGPDGNPIRHEPRKIVASYDNAATTTDNTRHWAAADNLSAAAANSSAVRQVLRKRARYEIANNSYARGMTLTLAQDTIGTGPKLQLSFDSEDVNSTIEQAYRAWAKAASLAAKLRTMRLAKCGDGETFAAIGTNPALRTRIKLDIQPIETDRITDNFWMFSDPRRDDGIEYDQFGNPVRFHVLRSHPGDTGMPMSLISDPIDAEDMVHMFRADRPGQRRGIPELTPALGAFAELRRFCEATIAAAETAADFAGVMQTTGPPIDPDGSDTEDAVEIGDAFELERRMMLTLPRGWEMKQAVAQHPSTTYEMFVNAVLREVARCLNMPFNIAAGDSSKYNYASGRLDDRIYLLAIRVERAEIETTILDRLLEKWWQEAVLIQNLIPPSLRRLTAEEIPHEWHWDRRPHADPVKEEMARKLKLEINDGTLAEFAAEDGVDPESRLAQRIREVKALREAGLMIDPQQQGAEPWQNNSE